MNDYEKLLNDVTDDLARIQDFDAETLVRRDDLGAEFAFNDAVDPAKRLISLCSKLPASALSEFPESQLKQISKQCKAIYSVFSEILSFSSKVPDAENVHISLISRLRDSYQSAFTDLFPYISYAVARTVDFNKLSEDGRAAVQGILDEKQKLTGSIEKTHNEAIALLEEVRKSAAEEGVTRQAKFFRDEAERHEDQGTTWRKASFWVGGILVSYSLAALFLFPLVGYLQPATPAEAIQVTGSKVLVFVVLAYGLIQCIKNYSAHKHNAVMNKHRQNALLTYTTLAEAGSTPEARDTILQHAAAAIYAPGDTGYVRNEERGYGGNPIVGFAPQQIIGGGSS